MIKLYLIYSLVWACRECFAHANTYKCYITLPGHFNLSSMASKIKTSLRTCYDLQSDGQPNTGWSKCVNKITT